MRQSATVLLGIVGIVLSVVVTDPPNIDTFASPVVGWFLLIIAGAAAAAVSLFGAITVLIEAEGVPADLAALMDLRTSPAAFRLRLVRHLHAVLKSIVEAVGRTQQRLRAAAISGVIAGSAFSVAMTARDVAF